MTNNDDLAIKLKAAAEKAKSAMDRYDAGEVDGGEAMELMGNFTDIVLPANILALLAERDADKKRIAELEARTVSVKLRKPGIIKSPMGVQCEVWERAEVESALDEAGIKLEVGE